MTKPISDYVSCPAISTLESEFSSTLEALSTFEKLHLLILLALQQQVFEIEPEEEYLLSTAATDHIFPRESNLERCIAILDKITSLQARSLMTALANQINNP